MEILIKYKGHMQNEGIEWDNKNDCPYRWNSFGHMDYLYGKKVKVLAHINDRYVIHNEGYPHGEQSEWYIYPEWVYKVFE